MSALVIKVDRQANEKENCTGAIYFHKRLRAGLRISASLHSQTITNSLAQQKRLDYQTFYPRLRLNL